LLKRMCQPVSHCFWSPHWLTRPAPWFRDAKELVKLLADGWQLDYRSPTVRGMLHVCAERLLPY
jgi:hypothetical protein